MLGRERWLLPPLKDMLAALPLGVLTSFKGTAQTLHAGSFAERTSVDLVCCPDHATSTNGL
jgi:hypothetical protein